MRLRFGRHAGLSLCGLVLLATTIIGSLALWQVRHPLAYGVELVQGGVFCVAAWFLLNHVPTGRRALWMILGLGLVMRALLVFAPPVSTDVYRYVWDGRVQAYGINPYRYVPADPREGALRDDVIYPRINRADYAPTIYPPAAQIIFFAVTRVAESVTAMKLAMVGFEAITVWALLRLLKRFGKPAALVLLYVWHPLPLWEFAGSGHIDAAAIAFSTLALLAATARRGGLAGVALGFATLIKFWPVVLGPALYRRWDWRLPVAFAATLAILYLPYLGAGSALFGFLGGYADEEGLRSGDGLFWWSLARSVFSLPSVTTFYLLFAAAALLVLGLAAALRRAKPGAEATYGLALSTVFTVLISPHYPWYFAWLVPFLCLRLSWAVLYLTAFSSLLYAIGWPLSVVGQSLLYGPFLLILVAEIVSPRWFSNKEDRDERPGAIPSRG